MAPEGSLPFSSLIGYGGVGKTSLAAKLVEQTKDKFEYVIWRSLLHAPSIQDILVNLIPSISYSLPDLDYQISLLIEYLCKHRCLLVLDNAESILSSGEGTCERADFYREGYEGYGELLRRVGEAPSQSCLLLTSREKPKELASLDGVALPVRSLRLSGLKQEEGQAIFKAKGLEATNQLSGLISHYAGNPLALKLVVTTIQDVFDGNTDEFLNQKVTVFGDIRDLLDQQFNRLSDLEKELMYWLAINRELVSMSNLRLDIITPASQQKFIELIESLGRRSLIEKSAGLSTLQPVVMEYVTNRLIEQVCQEIATQKLALFQSLCLLKATAKDYVKDIQVRLILKPVVDQLLTIFRSKSNIENHLTQILSTLRQKSPMKQGYSGGNIFNLLCCLKTDLSNFDFSYIMVWQADMRLNLHNVNFAHADLAKSIFAENFGGILSVALSPDGILAVGDTKGEIRLWQVADGKQLLTCKGHTGWVRSVAFSPDGYQLASGSSDNNIKLWNASTGQCLKTLQGHTNRVRSVAFSPDGCIISGSDDRTVKLWDVSTGKCSRTLQGHTNRIRFVTFSSNGQIIASGSDDQTIKLWDISTGTCVKTLGGHTDGVCSVAFSLDDQILASGSADQTVRLWDVSTGQVLRTISGHTDGVWSVAFSPDNHILASGSHDQTVKLWDVSTGQILRTLQGHNWVWSIAFDLQGKVLASGSADQIVRLWDINTGQILRTISGHSNGIWSVAFSHASLGEAKPHPQLAPQGTTLASVSDDQTIRLWDVNTGQILRTISGHSSGVWSVAFCPQGMTLASGSDDQTVKLWDVSTGQCLKTLHEHTDWVWSVTFSPDGRIIASGSVDRTVRLWNVDTGQCLTILPEHPSPVSSVTFSADGHTLAIGSDDGTVRLWDVSSRQCVKILRGHTDWVQSVAFSHPSLAGTTPQYAPQNMIASGSHDQTVKLWDASTGQTLRTLQGHTGWVLSVAFSPQGNLLASSSQDETIKLWDVLTGECLITLRSKRPYEGTRVLREAQLHRKLAYGHYWRYKFNRVPENNIESFRGSGV